MAKEFYNKIIAAGSRIVSKKGSVRLENSSNAASLEDTTYTESGIVDPSAVSLVESEEVISTDEIALPMPSDSAAEVSSPVQENDSAVVAEQDSLSVEVTSVENTPAAVETVPTDVEQNDPVVTGSGTSTEVTATDRENSVTHICQVCGSSQLLKQETKRRQQRYQCQVCGATNNFGPKRTRRHRQKNSVESLA
jgi:predicted RNA-binding Zn-ribbon protein involved in translation (DUF1610 family)